MGIVKIGRYIIGIILLIGGIALVAVGHVNEGVTAILTGLGILGVSKHQDNIKEEIEIIRAKVQ